MKRKLSKKDNKIRIENILRILKENYPNAKAELVFNTPFQCLVATMLSAQCTDKQVNKVTPAVFDKFKTVFDMADCPVNVLYPMVKSCGFSTKAKNIIETSKIIVEEYNGEVPNNMQDLTSLPGVGRKTANVVMANAYQIPTIAVDTHVFRVSNRLKIVDAKNVNDTEKQLMQAIPQSDWIDAHHWLILHGRKFCNARNPKCEQCPVNEHCPHYLDTLA